MTDCLISIIGKFSRDESGATAIEYALIVSGLVMLVLGSLGNVRSSLENTFVGVGNELAENNSR